MVQMPIGLFPSATKKEQNAYSYQIEKHEPFEQFQYSPAMDYSYAPVIQYESPGATATGATVTTTKKQTTSQEGGGFTPSSSQDQSMKDSTDLITPLLIIGAVGIGGYLLYKGFKKKK